MRRSGANTLPTMTHSRRLQRASLTLANILLPVAVLTFASGFFPYKPVLPGLAHFEEEGGPDGVGEADENGRARAAAAFDKVIFMVVDALRSDFVYGHDSGMLFTQRYDRHAVFQLLPVLKA